MTSSAAGGRPWLSVVVPTGTGPPPAATLGALARFAADRPFEIETLVVGGAAEAARGAPRPAGLVSLPAGHGGRGSAVRRAALAARGRWLLVLEPGLPVPADEYDRLATAARDLDLDVVVGLRPPGARPRASRTLGALVRALLGLPYRDVLSGFVLLDRARVEPLVRRMVVDGSAGAAELLFLAHRYRLRVAEVAVTARADAEPARPLADEAPRILADALRVRWRFRRGLYHPPAAVDKTPGSVHGG